jgi:ribonucleoside-diphosphate reductase alpha chain
MLSHAQTRSAGDRAEPSAATTPPRAPLNAAAAEDLPPTSIRVRKRNGGFEPVDLISNVWKRETLSGDFLQINRFLIEDLKRLGIWNETTRAQLKQAGGSVQALPGLPDDLRGLYRTAWEIPMRSLIDMAADRGAFIDQGQSLNLFVESPNIGTLSSMYFYAWKRGLKTTYYLRSRPATEILKTTAPAPAPDTAYEAATTIACSLENPESCEACQ